MRLSELAELTGARVEGATDDVEILGAAGLDEAGEGHVTFLANPRYPSQLNGTRASAVILGRDDPSPAPCAILRSDKPALAVLDIAGGEAKRLGLHPGQRVSHPALVSH